MEYILNLLLPFELFNNLFPGVIFIYFLKQILKFMKVYLLHILQDY